MTRALPILARAAAGCTATDPAVGCGAERYRDLVGQPLSALEAALPAGGYKVDLPLPDGTVTPEDCADRWRGRVDRVSVDRVSVDRGRVIHSVGCG